MMRKKFGVDVRQMTDGTSKRPTQQVKAVVTLFRLKYWTTSACDLLGQHAEVMSLIEFIFPGCSDFVVQSNSSVGRCNKEVFFSDLYEHLSALDVPRNGELPKLRSLLPSSNTPTKITLGTVTGIASTLNHGSTVPSNPSQETTATKSNCSNELTSIPHIARDTVMIFVTQRS
eukprot:gene331-255_t